MISLMRSARLVLAFCSLVCATGAVADSYPSRTIRIVVPYAAGGNSDVIARTLAARMSESLGQPVIVENRAGANAIIGSDFVAKARPDGYTLLMVSSGNLTTNPALFASLPYDTVRDFAPISNVAYTTYVLSVHPSLPVQSVKELIDLAKSQPGKIDAAIPGIGTGGHLALQLFMSMSGTTFLEVPFNGAAPALNATLAGHTKLIMDALSTSLPHVHAGTVRALGQSGLTRSALLPQLPTIAEAGLPGFEMTVSNALLGPAGLPRDIVDRLRTEIAKAGQHPNVQKSFAQQGIIMTATTPEELTDFIKSESNRWKKVIRAAGIEPR